MKQAIIAGNDVWISIFMAGLMIIGASIVIGNTPLGFSIIGITSWLLGGLLWSLSKYYRKALGDKKQ